MRKLIENSDIVVSYIKIIAKHNIYQTVRNTILHTTILINELSLNASVVVIILYELQQVQTH